MSVSLGGSLFIIDGVKFDYCFMESAASLIALCDEVVLLDAGSNDGTAELLKTLESDKVKVVLLDRSEWESLKSIGKDRLAHFKNLAIDHLTTDWNMNIEGDEVIHEGSFPFIREAINQDAEAWLCHRFNLWGTPYQMLNVPQNRKPCSNEVIRLAKTKYRSSGDAESLDAQVKGFVDGIRIFHMGFVRKPDVMIKKIINIQEQIYLMDYDRRIDPMGDKFDPWAIFSKDEVVPIPSQLPVFVKKWAAERMPNNS